MQEHFVRQLLPLRGFLHALVPEAHLVDDLIQETFLTACEKADTFTPGTNFKAWIFAIARFKALSAIKRLSGSRVMLDADVVELLAEDHEVDHALAARVVALDECIERLARRARQAVVLRYEGGLGPTEIAQRIGWTTNALNVALSRARDFLRKCVSEQARIAQALESSR